MVKFKGAAKNKNLTGFGLSEENVRKLKEGLPIVIDDKSFDSDTIYVIFYGKTEKDMYDELKTFMNDNTIIHE